MEKGKEVTSKRWAWYDIRIYRRILSEFPCGRHDRVYLVLCNHRRWEGKHKDTCFPSYATIAKEAHISRRSIAQIIADLKGLGVITVKYDKVIDRKNRKIGRKRNIYHILGDNT